jgi:predicted nucleotidyltransferase
VNKFAEHPAKDAILRSLQAWARARSEIVRVILFGSRVRGDHRADSDLDVAVELEAAGWDEEPFVTWTASAPRWRQELESLLPWPLDLQWHDLAGETPIITAGIQRSHFVAYEREPASSVMDAL